ncbi:hypothetical protein NX779_03070 [Mycoplasma cottewii]|uniref:Uncharacterized protein n=1 Tax=Mycoplasma cottewii TaxID=51364 RepID=A0ABY5TVU6_9MOLU|nr:hypothetical protein [Mycoplasma cottewii]UWD34772.1 hypothetical protein NX779_03070 [Mycoplasma cottewii]
MKEINEEKEFKMQDYDYSKDFDEFWKKVKYKSNPFIKHLKNEISKRLEDIEELQEDGNYWEDMNFFDSCRHEYWLLKKITLDFVAYFKTLKQSIESKNNEKK